MLKEQKRTLKFHQTAKRKLKTIQQYVKQSCELEKENNDQQLFSVCLNFIQ